MVAVPGDVEVRNSRREYAFALVVLLVGAVGSVVAYGATWVTVTVPVFAGEVSPTTQETFTGRELIGFGGAAGWVALAAVAGIIATRTWGRVIVGGVAVMAGATAGVAGLTFIFSRDALIRAAVDDGEIISAQSNLWWLLAAVSGLAVVVAGIMVVARGRRWAALGRRYERAGGTRISDGQPTSAAQACDALDQGQDPTVDDPRLT